MKSKLLWALCLALAAGPAAADVICPDSSYCIVSFATTKDRVTIVPNGPGETFRGTGITIRVCLKNCEGEPLVSVPAQEIVIYNSSLCICPGGNVADAATDPNGWTSFSGTIRGGGCAESLTIFADGMALCNIPVKTNSPDAPPASPCGIDASDLSAISSRLGRPDLYSICFDYNESGPPTIDSSDLGFFAATFGGAECR
jgi:hypothetical protein